MNTDNDVLVSASGVSKKFCRDLKTSLWYGVKDVFSEFLPHKGDIDSLRPDEFWANEGVSFELRRGQCLGLVGHNGAGKTTLLKMLNGLIKPDAGSIEMRGRVGALIALGAGFNPLLTGRENVYIAGSVLGLSKAEIDAKYDEIVEFAELQDFMKSPVQNYSSGMQVRLGFSVATSLDPDILLVDEVLAVGDASFRNKCYSRLSSLRRNAAVIFVSHNMGHVSRICDSTLVLEKGRKLYHGETEEGVALYEELNARQSDDEPGFLNLLSPLSGFEIQIPEHTVSKGSDFALHFTCNWEMPVESYTVRVALYSQGGEVASLSDTECTYESGRISIDNRTITLKKVALKAGAYSLGLGIITPVGDIVGWSYKQHKIQIEGKGPISNTHYQPEAYIT